MRGKVLSRLAPYAQIVVEQYQAGASFEELAVQYDCAAGTIRRFLLTQSVPLRPECRTEKLNSVINEVMQAFLNGETIDQIAEQHSVTVPMARKFILVKLPDWLRSSGK